jgi:hypothetical protein
VDDGKDEKYYGDGLVPTHSRGIAKRGLDNFVKLSDQGERPALGRQNKKRR